MNENRPGQICNTYFILASLTGMSFSEHFGGWIIKFADLVGKDYLRIPERVSNNLSKSEVPLLGKFQLLTTII